MGSREKYRVFVKSIGMGSTFSGCQGYFLAAPLDFPHRGKSRLEFMLALTDYLIAGEPWPFA